MMKPFTMALVQVVLVLTFHSAIASSGSTETIPRSSNRRVHDKQSSGSSPPPWNPSNQIDEDGFLKHSYWRLPGEWEKEADIGGKHGLKSRRYKQLSQVPVTIRQVPGDGNCLFHSISTCLSHVMNGTHVSMKDTSALRETSACLRKKAVDCLEKSPRRLLFLQGSEYLRARDLVEAAAAQYHLSGERYCELMRKESYWGGGPEIVALCNVLRRPIHVYELTSSSCDNHKEEESFRLRRMACFGSPKFDRREPLHILSADSRFPDVTPGKQLASGNHFLAMFPATVGKSRVVRGGGSLRRKSVVPEKEETASTKHNVEKPSSSVLRSSLLGSWVALIQKLSSKWFFGA